ncbi:MULTISPECIES: hypothetical protein [unclassified Streptomyces]|uniref:hypothetical protein n=1 Tax=unclassified Streptomyces TaxID=2593676 RepID=UPI000CD58BE9|nr:MULTISPECIES: hypothetical protein [unclassified Streptomyces]
MNLRTTRRQPSAAAVPRAPAAGFTALLLVLFTLAFATGSVVGPVAPALHPGSGAPATGGDSGHRHGAGR